MMYEWLLFLILKDPTGVAIASMKVSDREACEAVAMSFSDPKYTVKCIPVPKGGR